MKKVKPGFTEVNRKIKLTRRMKMTVAILSFSGIFCILYLMVGLGFITNKYSKVVYSDYIDTEYINEIGQQLYQHQTLVLEHMSVSSKESKDSIKSRAEELEQNINDNLVKFGKNVEGREYESYYHDIYSKVNGYFKNVDVVFDFSNGGQVETAGYYMETSLEGYIQDVNAAMETVDSIIKKDLQEAREKLDYNIIFVRITSVALFGVIIICTFFARLVSVKISNEMVNMDALTGVYNYDYFIYVGEKRLRKGTLKNYAVLNVNIKNFQIINQQIGTEYGDILLLKYARKLSKMLNDDEMISRINGDNFLVMLRNGRVDDFWKLIQSFNIDITMNDGIKRIQIQSRCGIYYVKDNVNIKHAVDKAFMALKATRSAGADDYICYSDEMKYADINAKQIISDFKNAIINNEFAVYYQPKVDMHDNRLIGCEALVRWIKNGKLIPPMEFIPILEDEGYITRLDMYVFSQVCRDIAQWKKNSIEPVRVSSNFSKLHLKNKNFADDIISIMKDYNVGPQYVEIEITESSGYEDFDALTSFVKRMSQENIFTAIDDFGTGYSSLSMLKDLNVDVIKLDKSFISGIEDNEGTNGKMVENIVKMINDLNRYVICEGVETREQADFLKNIKCFIAQGYLYDKPLPKEKFEERLMSPIYEV